MELQSHLNIFLLNTQPQNNLPEEHFTGRLPGRTGPSSRDGDGRGGGRTYKMACVAASNACIVIWVVGLGVNRRISSVQSLSLLA